MCSLPSSFTSEPEYLPMSTWSPAFIESGCLSPLSRILPLPTETTNAMSGFSLALSGMNRPPTVLSFLGESYGQDAIVERTDFHELPPSGNGTRVDRCCWD
jgi:hypothetical protein